MAPTPAEQVRHSIGSLTTSTLSHGAGVQDCQSIGRRTASTLSHVAGAQNCRTSPVQHRSPNPVHLEPRSLHSRPARWPPRSRAQELDPKQRLSQRHPKEEKEKHLVCILGLLVGIPRSIRLVQRESTSMRTEMNSDAWPCTREWATQIDPMQAFIWRTVAAVQTAQPYLSDGCPRFRRRILLCRID